MTGPQTPPDAPTLAEIRAEEPAASPSADPVVRKLAQWQNRLLDLTGRNRLLNHQDSYRGALRIVRPGFRDVFNQVVLEDHKLRIYTGDPDAKKLPEEPRTLDEDIPLRGDQLLTHRRGNDVLKALTLLSRALRTSLEEQGVHTLYLAFGSIEWEEESSGQLKQWRAPILLAPVTLVRATIREAWRIHTTGEELRVNPALVEKLRQSGRIVLPELPSELIDETPATYAAAVEATVQGLRGLKIAPEEVWLDRFDFAKVAIYQDLIANAEETVQHPIVRAIAGDPSHLPHPPEDVPDLDVLDERVQPGDTFHVLDADASQHRAIEIVKRGGNLLLEGPPGTGKSQTITNMIASCLAQGWRVLFVSEKRAALEVVWRRLHQVGLSDYCLDLHNPRSVGRAAVAKELARVLKDGVRVRRAPGLDLERLRRDRANLNGYVRELHRPLGALNRSYYEMANTYWTVADAPDVRFRHDNILNLSPDSLDTLSEAVARLGQVAHIAQAPDAHPFYFVPWTALTLSQREDLESRLSKTRGALQPLQQWIEETLAAIEQTATPTLVEARRLVRIADVLRALPVKPPRPDWLDSRDLDAGLSLINEAHDRADRLHAAEEKLFARYKASVLTLQTLAELEERFRKQAGSFGRIFSLGYWQARAALAEHLKDGAHLVTDSLADDCATAQVVLAERQWFAIHRHRLERWLADEYVGIESPWETMQARLKWIGNLREAAGDSPLSETFLWTLTRPDFSRREWNGTHQAGLALLTRADDLLDKLGRSFPDIEFSSLVPDPARLPLRQLQEWFTDRLQRLDQLEEWIAYQRSRAELRDLGFDSILTAVVGTSLAPQDIQPAVLKRLYRLWLDAAQQVHPELAYFRRTEHERIRDRFVKGDSLLPKTGVERLATRLEQSRPGDSEFAPADSELGILKHQSRLKRGHLTVRRMLGRIPELSLRIKPCWMMSPLTVSQYLSPAHRFDVVIFDEASQVRPEDAIAAIRHARRAVIVGDDKQMPPTSFFQAMDQELAADETEEWDETLESLESILDEASRIFPSHRLTWHYRSRDESLIAFSNRAFYDSRLITFPAPRVPATMSAPPTALPQSATVEPVAEVEVGADHVPILTDEADADAENSLAEIALTRQETSSLVDAEPPPATDLPEVEVAAEVPAPVLTADSVIASTAPDASVSADAWQDVVHAHPLGVRLVSVPRDESDYAKGRNPAEARRVVETLVRIHRAHPHHSIGVIAFGRRQAALIEDLLEEVRADDSELDACFAGDLEEPFFVKNLETVQGDERDIILFSVTYGPDETGKVRLNFGPIQQNGGERRLNVAFTRARYQVVVVSSMLASDIDTSRAQSVGAARLKEYLAFAAAGGHGIPIHTTELERHAGDALRTIAQGLAARGFIVDEKVGQGSLKIDLAVRHPEDPTAYVLGIENDGRGYVRLGTARDRERTRPAVLRGLGWNLERLWTPDQVLHPEGTLARIEKAIAAAAEDALEWPAPKSRDISLAVKDVNAPVFADDGTGKKRRRRRKKQELKGKNGTPEAEEDPEDARPLGHGLKDDAADDDGDDSVSHSHVVVAPPRGESFAIYETVELTKPAHEGELQEMPSEVLVPLLAALADGEGPIHWEAAAQRLTTLWDVPRRTKKMTEAITDAIQAGVADAAFRANDVFLWPASMQPSIDTAPARQPADGEKPRDIAHIAPEELQHGLLILMKAAVSCSRESLINETAIAFGYARAGKRIQEALEQAVTDLIDSGTIHTTKGDVLRLAESS